MNLLSWLVISPLIGLIILLIIPRYNVRLLKKVALFVSFFIFNLSLVLWELLNKEYAGFQYLSKFDLFGGFNLVYIIGVDSLSIFFVILTAMLIPICILCSWTTIKYRLKEFLLLLFFMEFLLFNVFLVLDLLLFYVFFESVLIPMFIIIGVWGSRERRIHAAYQFFLYTLFGSVIMLLGIMLVYLELGSTSIWVLLLNDFSEVRQIIIWFTFFCSFGVKVPMVPVHIWLPEAHVEAPTAGSVVLAGILLKMGTYGLLRFSLPILPEGTEYFMPLAYMLCIVGIIYASLTTIRQIDMKKIIAYSSVGHMNFVVLGIMSQNLVGMAGSVYLMLGHGLVSSALFLCVGQLYERYGSRLLVYYGGLVYGMPIFAIIFLFFTFANVSLPGTSNFIGEFLVIIGVFVTNYLVGLLGTVGVILGAVYAIWLYNRVIYGEFRDSIIEYADVNKREFYIYMPLILLVMLLGIFPGSILNYLELSLVSLVKLV